jgi:hypothetical protein
MFGLSSSTFAECCGSRGVGIMGDPVQSLVGLCASITIATIHK